MFKLILCLIFLVIEIKNITACILHLSRSLVEKTERIVSLSKLSHPVDFKDAQAISEVPSGNVNKHTFDNIEDAKTDSEEFSSVCARSVPGKLQ